MKNINIIIVILINNTTFQDININRDKYNDKDKDHSLWRIR
jgi:hypothetical protein